MIVGKLSQRLQVEFRAFKHDLIKIGHACSVVDAFELVIRIPFYTHASISSAIDLSLNQTITLHPTEGVIRLHCITLLLYLSLLQWCFLYE